MTWTYGKRLVMPRPIVVSGRLDDWMGSLMCMGWLNMFLENIGKFINFILRMINITKTEATWDQMIHRSTNTIRKRYQDPKGSMGFVFILLSNIQKMEYIYFFSILSNYLALPLTPLKVRVQYGWANYIVLIFL